MSILDRPISRRQVLKAGAAVPAAMMLAQAAPAQAAQRARNAAKKFTSGSITMTMSDWWGSQFGHYYPEMQKLTGVTIDQQLYPYSPTKLLTQIDAGSAADFFLIASQWNGTLLTEAEKVLVPFDSALKSQNVDMSKWNISPTIDNGYGGHIWGLDLFVTQDVIGFVNTELAEKGGMLKDLPLWGTPSYDTWKWPQWVDWLKAGTKVTSSGKVEQYGYSASAGYLFQPILASLGGQLMNNPWDYNETKSLFDTPEVIETVQTIANLYIKDKVAAPLGVETALGGPNSSGASFLAQKALATQGWSTPSVYPVETNFPMSYIHLPYLDYKVHAVGSNSLAVNKTYSDPQVALDWIITFTTNTEVRKNFIIWSSVPAYDPLPIVNATPAGDPKTISLINLSRVAGQSPLPNDTKNIARWPYWLGRFAPADFQNAITSVPEQVILGKATAKDACQAAAKQLNAAIVLGRSAVGM
jgi:maltose-binding protein MalE